MSDSEDNESEGDFSASEDDWVPGKHDKISSDSDDEIQTETPKSNRRQSGKILKHPTRRSSLIKQYQRAKAVTDRVNLSLARTSNDKTMQQITVINNDNDDDDSDSSVENYLVNYSDFNSKTNFLDVQQKSKATPPPEFDCNAGLQLSDSEENSDDDGPSTSNVITVKRTNHNFDANLEAVKTHATDFKMKERYKRDETDVTKLLALGEPSKKEKQVKKILKRNPAESDSDWEDVEAGERSEPLIKDVQITVGPAVNLPRKKLTEEEEFHLALKRRINRRKKEIQITQHKTHLLLWIGHGNYVNKILNHPDLMKMCLNLLPSDQCYPKDRVDFKYIEQITKWYRTKMKLDCQSMNPTLKKMSPLSVSLALQIKNKIAICQRDFIYIFIILLRALGVQCRLVLNSTITPIRPPASELCVIKMPSQTGSAEVKPKSKQEKTKEVTEKKTKIETLKRSSKRQDTKNDSETIKASSTGAKPKMVAASENIKTRPSRRNKPNVQPESSPVATTSTSLGTKLKRNVQSVRQTKTEPEPVPSKRMKIKIKLPEPIGKRTDQRKRKVEKIKDEPTKKQKTEDCTVDVKLSKNKLQASNVHNGSPIFSTNKINCQMSPVANRTRRKGINNVAAATVVKKISQLDGNSDEPKSKSTRSKRPNLSKLKVVANKQNKNAPNVVDDSQKLSTKSKNINVKKAKVDSKDTKAIDRRVLSTDDENDDGNDIEDKGIAKKGNGINIWIEIYSEKEGMWTTVNLLKSKVNCVESIRKTATKPMSYVFAWNNNNTIKDVSPRYCQQWHTATRRLRVEESWLDKTLRLYKDTSVNIMNRDEDAEFMKINLNEQLPKSISEYKNHPLFVLTRHLLKFEGIYPPNSSILGYIRNEAVYSRDCVHTLHSREIWVKSARVVKPGQEPYKIVKARPKWNRATNTMLAPEPLEIFGYWQTQPYEPPTAENGIVPRNAYGNVELFKPEMLPYGTVHLQLNGLNKTCKKMGIDCAQAVVGFDFHSGSSHPTFDGFVVCKEFAEKVIEQWWTDQEEAANKEKEKNEQRIFGNWKKLIRGLLIRERLQLKYNFNKRDEETTEKVEEQKTTKTSKPTKRTTKK